MVMTKKQKDILKEALYILTTTTITALLIYHATHDAKRSISLACIDAILKIIVYHIHEIIWTVIPIADSTDSSKVLATIEIKRKMTTSEKQELQQKLRDQGLC
jgi:uncharacterized membrane protein